MISAESSWASGVPTGKDFIEAGNDTLKILGNEISQHIMEDVRQAKVSHFIETISCFSMRSSIQSCCGHLIIQNEPEVVHNIVLDEKVFFNFLQECWTITGLVCKKSIPVDARLRRMQSDSGLGP